MTERRYHPQADGWILMCRADLVLAVDPLSGPERVDSLWSLVHGGAVAATLLDELTRGGISAAPGFALVDEASGSRRLLVRGAVRVEVAGSAEVIDGAEATAWVEKVVPGSEAIRFHLASGAAEGRLWPILAGVVHADVWEVIDPAAEPKPEPKPKPQPNAKPEPQVVSEQTRLSQTISAIEKTEGAPSDAERAGGAATADSDYDHLFGMTVVRKVEDAAVREAEAEAEASAPLEDRTKVATDLAERRALRRAAKAAGVAAAPAEAPRHWLELSTGGREALDGVVIVGRAPTASRVLGGNIPRLVTMNTPNQDISRTHAQIAIEGGTVLVTDLHSSNGTFVTLPGRTPQKLRAGEPTPVVVDTVIDLGDGATLTVRVES